ncbi:MAG: site-specific tyrosine recombinase XerD [Bacteroidales bacterium]|nr:site-specific tyrosine recombinase XerD [Bacteroidales bacterium]
MIWDNYIKGFKTYLQLEKSLSSNTIEAYIHDVEKLSQYLNLKTIKVSPEQIELKQLQEFIKWLNEFGVSSRTQSRIISGIKSFYKYLLLEDVITNNPTELLDSPKIGRKLPDTLSLDEINKLISAIDLSKAEGERNKAMLETLYGCGLRVSELTGLKLSGLYFDAGFIKITGKGNKERLVPLGSVAKKHILIYLDNIRHQMDIKKESEDILFLNKRGRKLSRVMVFIIIKDLASKIGLEKNISPHTFRHSFASHLVDRGADLRAVQEMLGHESITTTEIYTHLDRQYLRDNILQYHPRSKGSS